MHRRPCEKAIYRFAVLVGLPLVLAGSVAAQIMFPLDAPGDDYSVRLQALSRPEVKAAAIEWDRFAHARLWPLKIEDFKKALGQPLFSVKGYYHRVGNGYSGYSEVSLPKDLALPIYSPGGGSAPGMGFQGDNSHHDLYAIDRVGFLEVFYRFDGIDVADLALFDRVDADFAPLITAAEVPRRIAWDKAKWVQVKTQLDKLLPKCKDLGVVEVATNTETRLPLGSGKTLGLRALHTSGYFLIDIRLLVTPEEAQKLSPKELDDRQQDTGQLLRDENEPVGFAIDGEFYQLTPKFTKKILPAQRP